MGGGRDGNGVECLNSVDYIVYYRLRKVDQRPVYQSFLHNQ